jgi:membrane-bound metal-dependent hydrolase YbcI (DUF457 family)
MATPVGHTLAGLAVSSVAGLQPRRADRSLVLLTVLMAVAPDLDVLPGLLLNTPARFHSEMTHSLAFALVISVVVAGVYYLRRGEFARIFKLCFVAYTSHLVLDMMGADGREPFGIPLLWPFSDTHLLFPVTLLPGVRHASSASSSLMEFMMRLVSVENIITIGVEILLISPFILLGRWRCALSSRLPGCQQQRLEGSVPQERIL